MNLRPEDAIGEARLPPELTARLQKMIWRVRRILWLRGLLATGAVLLGCALAIMAVDAAVLIFSPAVRWGLSVAGLAATLATAWVMLVRPLSKPLSITRMARVLETRHPELQERISSAIELLSMGSDAASRGSEQLVALLAQDAQADMRAVQPRHEFRGRSLKPALLAAAGGACVLGLLYAVWPRQTALLLKRAVAPYRDFATLQGEGLLVEPGDAMRLQGDALTIRLLVKEGGSADRAEVRCLPEAGPETMERMRRTSVGSAPDSRYELTFPAVGSSFRYRVRCGAGLTRFYSVTVLPPPAVTRLSITCRSPAYTRLPVRTLPEGAHDITAVAGTRVEMEADFNRSADGVVQVGQRRFPGVARKTPGASWSLVMTTNMTDHWSLLLRDANGFTGRVETASLKVIPDRVPVVTTRSPYADRLTLPPYGQVTCAFEVNEDFGLTRAELVCCMDGGAEHVQPFALQSESPESWTGSQDLDLAHLRLDGVRQITVWLRVFDTLPPELGGPQKGESRPIVITLDGNARRIEDQLRAEQKKSLQEMLKAAAGRLTQGAGQVNNARAQVGEDPIRPAVMQGLTVAQERAATAEDLTRRAAGLCAQSFFATLAPRIRDTATEVIEPARVRTAEIVFAEAGKRPAKAAEAGTLLADAAARVQDLVAAIEELDKKLEEVSKTGELAQRERALADQAGEKKMTQAELEAWKAQQVQVSRELAAQPGTDPAILQQAQELMAAAAAALNREKLTARDDQATRAARMAASAAQQASLAAEKSGDAADHAGTYARDRAAADATENAARLAEAAAQQAEKAAVDANLAAQQQQSERKADAARERQASAKMAQQAAQEALQAAGRAEQAAGSAEAAAQQQEQGHAEEAGRKAEASGKDAQAARQQGEKARQDAQQAAGQARQEQADKVEQGANLATDAAEMATRAAELAREANDQAAKAEHLSSEQRQAQTRQAADKAQQAGEMARQAEKKAREADQMIAAQAAAEQQAAQDATRAAGAPEQIREAARHAGQEAQQAAQMAQAAATATRQAVDLAAQTRDPQAQQAAQESAEAAQLADQAASLAARAEQRIEKTEGQPLSGEKAAAENKLAVEDADAATQLARDAAAKARHAALAARHEMTEHARVVKEDTSAAAALAAEAARESTAAEQMARASGAEPVAEAARLGGQAGELARQAGELDNMAMQSAAKNSAEGDQQGVQQAEQAAARAHEAAALARQAAARAQAAEQAPAGALEARQHAEDASRQMAAMAAQEAARLGQPATPPGQWRTESSLSTGEQQQRQDTMNPGTRSFVPFFLRNLGFPESDWARYKGKTESEAMEEMLRSVSPEYRELVRRYFVELSREGGKGTEAQR